VPRYSTTDMHIIVQDIKAAPSRKLGPSAWRIEHLSSVEVGG